MVFDAISSNINEVISMNSSANVLAFVDFIVHHQDRHILVELMDLVNYVNGLT